MTHFYLIFYTFIIFFASLSAATEQTAPPSGHDEELFLQAQHYYTIAQYEQVLATYQAIKHKGRAVFHNMGNTFYYLNNPVEALAHWRRALPGASRTEYDALVKAHALVTGDATFASPAPRLLHRAFNPFSLFALQILFLACWYLCFFLLWRYKRTLPIWCILIGSFLGTLISGYGIWLKYTEQSYPYAIVRVESTPLFAGPDTNYHHLQTTSLLDELMVTEEIPGWCRVTRYKDGHTGWIQHNDITIVK